MLESMFGVTGGVSSAGSRCACKAALVTRAMSTALALVAMLAGCSTEPPAESRRESAQRETAPLVVSDPAVPLPITLPETNDPLFAGLTIPANAPTKGMWSPSRDWPLNGLHSVLLPNGRVLTYGTPAGNAATQDGRTFDVWDPMQGFTAVSHRTRFNAQQVNSFCSAASFLPNGTLLVSGGNGPLDSSEFDPAVDSVTTSAFRLAYDRWYGSMITLPDGRLLMLGGSGPYAALRAHEDPAAAINAGTVSMTPEIYEPGTGFRSLFGAYSREAFGPDHHRYWYPRAWVAPNGEVFGISSEKMWSLDYSGNGSIRVLGNFKTGVNASTRPNIGPTSTAVMFAPGRILQVGGNGYYDGHATPSSARATVIDINGATPVVTETNSMSIPRQWVNSLVLPDGRVLVTGGTRYANNGGSDAVYEAELWDPATGNWTTGALAARIRVYHSAAILLPNGTVLSTGGGAPGPVNNLNAEVYYPPYLFRSTPTGGAELAPRPRLAATSTLAPRYGDSLHLDLADAASIQKAVLIGASSVTHSFNSSQRRLELEMAQNGRRVSVAMPVSANAAPPGYYLLFLVDAAGVPSNGVLLSLGENMAAPPVPTLLPRGNEITLMSANTAGHALSTDTQSLGVLKPLGADSSEEALLSTRFVVRDGLADSNCVSLESVAQPGRWLRHYSYRVRLAAAETTDLFKNDATFCSELGLSGTGVTLRSKNFPTYALRHRGLELWIDPVEASSTFAADATFVLRTPALPVLPAVHAPIIAAGTTASYAPEVSLPNALYRWDFGDGSEPSAESASSASSHTYTAPGVYLVTLTARLPDGRQTTKTFVQAVHGPLTAGAPRSSSPVVVEPRASGVARVWQVNPDTDTVSVFDTASLTRTKEITVRSVPESVAVAPNGRIWVVNRESASISVIDAEGLSVVATISLPTASRPRAVVFSPSAARAYVSLDALGSVAELDALSGSSLRSFDVGPNPRGLSITADGTRLLVSRFISPPAPGEHTTTPNTTEAKGELRVIELPAATSARVIALRHSNREDGPVQGRGLPNYLGAAVVSPDGKSAWVPSKQDNIARGSARDGQHLDFQNTVRAVTSRIDLATELEWTEQRVDHDNASVASAAVFHPSGVYVFVALETSRQVAAINAFTGSELFRIETGRAPQGLAISPDGSRLYVLNFMDRTLSAVDLLPLVQNGEFQSTTLATIKAITTEKLASGVLLGKQLFYDARDPRLARDAYMSCASCHADGDSDGRVWDLTGMGEGLRNTISLVGRSGAQGLLHWSGNFDEVQDFETQIRELAGGTGLMPDATYFAGTRAQPLGATKAGLSADLDALAAYVKSLSRPEPSPFRSGGELTPEGDAGRAVFAAAGCAGCHSGATFSNETDNELKDIGTLTPASGKRLSQPLLGIDVPTLRGVWATAPYLHDGSAPTLADAITAHAGVSVTATELADLVEFVRQIDGDEPPVVLPTCTDGVQNGTETGVDCGGACAACPTCSDGIQNGTETGVDCGGSCEPCVSCSDGIQNGTETGVDCGGTCAACPTCSDGIQNGTETGVDCGGTCAACNTCTPTRYEAESITKSTGGSIANGWNIWSNGYVQTQHTFGTGSTTITVRAYGSIAANVWPNLRLSVGGSVVGNATVNTTSWALYTFTVTPGAGNKAVRVEFTNDYNQNGQDRNLYVDYIEIGCGGAPPAPSCSDGIKNGNETAVDCGGSCAADCANGQACLVNQDCQSGSCVANTCQAPTSGGLQAILVLDSTWNGGYCASVTIKNGSTATVNTWTVTLNLNQSTLSSSWSANFAGTGATRTVTPLSWNATLAPNGTTGVGFCANTTGSNWQPTIGSVK